MLSSSNIPTFCEEFIDNSALYYYQEDNLNDTSYLLNISSLQIQSPCVDTIKRYLCYYHYPVCNVESGKVVQLCNSNCGLLSSDSSCSDLIVNVTRELELVGEDFPDIECETNSETNIPCFDIVNGKTMSCRIYTPLCANPLYTLPLLD